MAHVVADLLIALDSIIVSHPSGRPYSTVSPTLPILPRYMKVLRLLPSRNPIHPHSLTFLSLFDRREEQVSHDHSFTFVIDGYNADEEPRESSLQLYSSLQAFV